MYFSKEMKIDVMNNICKHEPEPIVANRSITIFYNKIIPVGKYIEGNAIKPYIVIWNRQNKTAKVIKVNVPNEYGLNRAKRTKIPLIVHGLHRE